MLLSKFPDKFSLDFAENKKIVGELIEIESKKVIAQIAGKVTRLKKLQQTQ